MSIMISTPLVIGPGSVTAEMMDSGVAAAGEVLTADGVGGADFAAPAGGGPGYLEYVALLSQAGTSAPVATVLKNTLGGTVVWTRYATGIYRGTLTGAFPEQKTIIISSNNMPAIVDEPTGIKVGHHEGGSDYVYLGTMEGWISTDGLLAYTPIEVRVYP